MPPHLGHCQLIEFARNFTHDLNIVIGSLANEPIPGILRYQWLKELFPHQNILHLRDENPQHPDEDQNFWDIWEASLKRILDKPIKYVFASEEYGAKLAEVLGAEFIPNNAWRNRIPVSGTQIRQSPLRQWNYLPLPVKAYYCRKVAIIGPESTGKSCLAEQLSEEFRACLVPEYARTYLQGREDSFELKDMEKIARGQQASVAASMRSGKKILICDTDPLSTKIWSQELFGEVDPEVEFLSKDCPYHLTLLLDVDVPWVEGPLRMRPNNRKQFFLKFQKELDAQGRDYHIIRGDWSERCRQARKLLGRLLRPPFA